jgi:hypothetical protein
MRRIATIITALLIPAASAWCQCADGTTVRHVADNILRTSGNQIYSFSQSWVSGGYAGTWTVYAAAQIAQNGANIHTGSDTQNSGNIASVSWYDTLESVGPGAFTEADQHNFSSTCGDNLENDYTDRNLTVSRPTISPPSGIYGANQWAMWYMNGLNSPNGFLTTADLTTTTNLGDCGGCTPAYLWVNADNPGAVSFSSTNTTTATITSQRASGGATYDTSVNFSMDGFYAASKLSLNLNTPAGFNNNRSANNDDGACGGYGSYNSPYQYVPYDLWTNALGQIALNEKNDMFVSDFPGLVGWYTSPNWVYDDNWNPADWDDMYHFTDNLGAKDCGFWTPHTESPPGGTNTAVFHVPQTFYVGSATSGTGVAARSDTQHFYTDHGSVTVP